MDSSVFHKKILRKGLTGFYLLPASNMIYFATVNGFYIV
jgi:hypothetical protein